MTAEPVDLKAVRQKLAGKNGPEYWRSLEQLAETDEFVEMMHREFPRGASVLESGIERRSFLKCMGASLALAGLNAACSRQPDEFIVPYVKPPAEMTPGTPVYFATAMPQHGYAIGLVAKNHTGRPVKLEGNPHHPASLGATDIFAQASILSLYDPDRSAVALRRGSITTWESFTAALDIQINGEKDAAGTKISNGLRDKGGAGIRILTGTVTSPTLAAQMREALNGLPAARWHQYEPCNRDNVNAGARMAFDEALNATYKFDLADVVVALDSNFLCEGPGSVRYSRDFANRRTPEDLNGTMNRLYVIESTPTVTGATADHSVHVRPSDIETFARAIARKLGLDAPGRDVDAAHAKLIDTIAADLQAHKGKSILLVGDSQPPIVHAIAHAINGALGNGGATVVYTDPVEAEPVDQLESLRTLVNDMNAGSVDTLIIVGVNPVYDAPADLSFAAAMEKVNHRVHMGLYLDETAQLCHWHLPEAHYLESWSDCRAFDGTVALIQPLIAPMYGGKTAHELVAALFGKGGTSYDIIRQYWQAQRGPTSFETFWRESLAKGVVDGSAYVARQAQPRAGITSQPQAAAAQGDLEVAFRPDPTIGDGRWANNGWLQELPKPLLKITWDNSVLVSMHTAESLGLSNFDFANVKVGERSVRGQVWIQPGHPDHLVTLHLGYGRTHAGKVGNGTGFNAYPLRASDGVWNAANATIARVSGGPEFARTELHQFMTEQNRPLARMATLAQWTADPDIANKMHHAEHSSLPHHEPAKESLYDHKRGYDYDGYGWSMAIDLNKCTGCNVCTIACQAENNIPVVGKEQVIRGREMHWIRVDRYYKGSPEGEVQVVHQPVPCMQCENAPCEVVCPVGATAHSNEGLNDMVYNRCVGTRYCSNNCPYKVRRFNFLEYADLTTPTKQMMYNPDVTVRTRGVMEKCTYCVQRINLARIDAKKDQSEGPQGRKIREGEVITACQQACPSGAIVFGDMKDPDSGVAKLRARERRYALLADLNTRPRTVYLAKLLNENPELADPTKAEHGSHH